MIVYVSFSVKLGGGGEISKGLPHTYLVCRLYDILIFVCQRKPTGVEPAASCQRQMFIMPVALRCQICYCALGSSCWSLGTDCSPSVQYHQQYHSDDGHSDSGQQQNGVHQRVVHNGRIWNRSQKSVSESKLTWKIIQAIFTKQGHSTFSCLCGTMQWSINSIYVWQYSNGSKNNE